MTSLAEDLLLLAYNAEGANSVGQPGLDYGLAGALLVALTLEGRVDVVDKRVVVLDSRPTGEVLADAALAVIAADPKARKPEDWISRLSKGLRERVLAGLVEAGVLRAESDRVLWVFPRTRYPAAVGTEAPAETQVRFELGAALDTAGPVAQRTAALMALVEAVGAVRRVFPDRPAKQTKARVAEITAGNWGAAAAKKAIEQVQAALAATIAITAATSAATSAGS
ncbi:hypothetical protein F4553_000408 [Allocatelliglobosispora scoriae]|uniref:GPP34 family phosphoprotein n=1 Tax=Allocatelliglobosispora scoriae TaxID=643052 RepID=A0A841BIN4_9ACTN|nr:GPP34 family phosphoprotein [Allocatelliglobosispora scoriae]MBB5867029.1 hypothetical protein [Allocatelliglobosispora scoriae]